jgi:ElaB/YqjD/DUF883 family membrane-anchored ribosome-binding protein
MSSKPRGFTQAIDELETGEKQSGPKSGGAADELRTRLEQELHRLEETLKNMKPHFDDISEKVTVEAKKARDTVEDQVVKNPWAALGMVGLIFFVLGFLLGGRRND